MWRLYGVKMAATFHIDMLIGKNYYTWKVQMRSVLKEAELYDHIEGPNSVKPETIDANYAE